MKEDGFEGEAWRTPGPVVEGGRLNFWRLFFFRVRSPESVFVRFGERCPM
jgi:hypothetical protein